MTDFPMDAVIFNKIVEVFNQTRRYVLLLFPLAFSIRIAFGFILLKTDSFTDILKDSLFLFLGLFFFTDILKLALQIPYFVSSELSLGDWRNINLGEGIFTRALKRVVDWIGILSYWISFGLYIVIVSILGFFAGYILFFGTMFRLYGMLKIFFVLLFTVSLWPLLWHSINFAVYTIAVSDNAFANNIIIGGASLAKVFIPIWLISKTSKFPVAQALKKVSFTGGSLAYAGGSYAYSALKNNTNNIFNNQDVQHEKEMNNEGAEISITDTSFQENENSYINEQEDFSISDREEIPEIENSNHNELSFEENNQQSIEQDISTEQTINQENNIQNDINKDFHVETSPQEVKETQNISENQNYNESILENPKSESLENKVSNTEQTQKIFNEGIHKEDWIEGEENLHRPPQREKNQGDAEL
ncbi:MAG: hypothetical protein OXN83_05755 [Oligoflexia bacterium]|nr:hypothetical protein [Oligoflexia bacterium]